MSASEVPVSHRQVPYAIPPGATEIVLVRHGASAPYVPGQPFPLKDGHGDPALDGPGRAQAVAVADRMVNERVDAVYVTTLRRTLETIQPYLDRTGRTAEVVADLREVYLGEWEGGLIRERVAAGDERWARSQADGEWGHVPGAETTGALQARCMASLRLLHDRHPNQRIVCVVHGGVIGVICKAVTGSAMSYHWGAENASMHTVIAIPGQPWRLHRFNDTLHLAGLQ